MTTTTGTKRILAEAKAHFIVTYKRILNDKLQAEFDEEGFLQCLVKGRGYLSASLLNDVDAEAYMETFSEFAWQLDGDQGELHQALQDADMYESVDYDAIVASIEKAG